jgi:hypothetical protein
MDTAEVAVQLTATGVLYANWAEFEAAQQDKDA